MRLYAVIPTHNRHADLAELLASIPREVETLVIDNASTPPIEYNQEFRHARHITMHRDDEQPPNLSRLWNVGLEWATDLANFEHSCDTDPDAGVCPGLEEYAVAVLNDDVVLPPGFLTLMADELAKHDVDIAFPGGVGEQCWVNTNDGTGQPFPGVGLRLTGWCFVVRGSSGLRADESLRWWCGDDDLQAQAVTNGRGTVRVGLTEGTAKGLLHKHPDESTTGVLREQTEKDMTTFVEKWGQRPW